jgi:hypothetical protein
MLLTMVSVVESQNHSVLWRAFFAEFGSQNLVVRF